MSEIKSITWAEFLIHILKTHANTLHRLAAFFGEAELVELLESCDETSDNSYPLFEIKREWLPEAAEPDNPSAYLELEGAVHDMHLSPVLEFHLWAYPLYRIIIESSVSLKSKIPDQGSFQMLELLVEEAILQAQAWTKKLPIRPDRALQTNNIAQVPWIRFRTMILGKIGRRPIVALG